MAQFRLTRRAEADVVSIGAYTLRTWGEDQTVRYLEDLEASCQMVADNPALGRVCDAVHPGLLRMESGQHVVFYRQAAGGILISRILHQRMLPERHAINGEDEEE